MKKTTEKSVDQVSARDDAIIWVREKIRVMEGGEEVSWHYHRYTLTPLDDVSGEDKRVKDIAGKVHTKAVKDAFIAKRDKSK